HTGSRGWEYPFACHPLRQWREMLPPEPHPRVIDLGSGVTFFPFSVAQLGCRVICADIDPICATDIARAVKAVSTAPGSVDFRKVDGEHLPFNDDEADAIYCISVLEHITAFKQTVAEMARVLKPGGLLVLTIDLDLRSDSELGVNDYHRLRAELARHFTQAQPEETVHPMDMLQSNTGPYPMQRTESWLPWLFVKRKILRPLLGRASTKQYSLAVAGFVLTRK
ncbi:MAG: class I SAM-dependent methyltransferase, partial [Candidatus Berkelbacteria bacterium]|nr:class I SAM-dependent methyltransferase [Candidatus Berkelbacteria bacterium]